MDRLSRAVFTLILSFITASTAIAEEPVKSPIVATYTGHSISLAEIDREIDRQPRLAYYLEQNPDKKQELRNSVVDKLINRDLLLTEAKAAKTVDEKEVTKFVDEFIAGYGGKEKLEQILQGFRTDFPAYTAELADGYRLQKYIDGTMTKGITILPVEIEAAFNANPAAFATGPTVRARHILIKSSKKSSPDADRIAKEKADTLHKQAIGNGVDFGDLAEKNSEDTSSAVKGGDLGFFGKGMMVPEFEATAFSLKPGEVSQLIRSEFGYHIIKVEETKPGEKPSLEKARPQIETQLLTKKREEIVTTRLKSLREKVGVRIQWPG